jgi:hypothetical protein
VAWAVTFDETSSGRVEINAAGDVAALTVQGSAHPEIHLRRSSRATVDFAGSATAMCYAWDDTASSITAADDAASTLSTYNQSNLSITGSASVPFAVEAHHNSQLLVSGSVTVTPDRSVAVQISGETPTVNGTCLLQRIEGTSPPVFEPPV